jgi:hypothetical protein
VRTSLIAAVFVVPVISLSVSARSENFHLSG